MLMMYVDDHDFCWRQALLTRSALIRETKRVSLGSPGDTDNKSNTSTPTIENIRFYFWRCLLGLHSYLRVLLRPSNSHRSIVVFTGRRTRASLSTFRLLVAVIKIPFFILKLCTVGTSPARDVATSSVKWGNIGARGGSPAPP